MLTYNAKVGTIPARIVVLYKRKPLAVGDVIRFRHERDGHYGKIHKGTVDRLEPVLFVTPL